MRGFTVLVLSLLAGCAAAPIARDMAPVLVEERMVLWDTLYHACLPAQVASKHRLTNADTANLILAVFRAKWSEVLEKRESDTERAAFLVGNISHTVIDLYWPGTVSRDDSGAITAFHTCEELGGIATILEREKQGLSKETQGEEIKKAIEANVAVVRAFRYGASFDVVADALSYTTLRVSESRATDSVVPRLAAQQGVPADRPRLASLGSSGR